MDFKKEEIDAGALAIEILKGIEQLHARLNEIEKRLTRLEANYGLEVDWHNRIFQELDRHNRTINRYLGKIFGKVEYLIDLVKYGGRKNARKRI